jgi:hypothetical protein
MKFFYTVSILLQSFAFGLIYGDFPIKAFGKLPKFTLLILTAETTLTGTSFAAMKQISEEEEKPVMSSFNIYPEALLYCRTGWEGGSNPSDLTAILYFPAEPRIFCN